MINLKNSEWIKKTDFYNNGDRFYLSPLASTIRLIDRIDGKVIREFHSFSTSFASQYWDEDNMNKAQRECLKMNRELSIKWSYTYQESDDDGAGFRFHSFAQVGRFIEEHNEYFKTDYRHIEDYNAGEEYRHILIKY